MSSREPTSNTKRYGRHTLEFIRVAKLSDGLFAIALILLVFTLDSSAVSLDRPDGVLRDQPSELIAFVISFAVIANFWWIHHRFLANLAVVEPGLMGLNLALLGLVALIPFPTSLLGRDPTAFGAVVHQLTLLSIIAFLHLLLLIRANAVNAWRSAMPDGLFPWLLAGWGASAIVTLLGLGLAFFIPLAGLAMLLLTWSVEAAVAWFAPGPYRDWG